jgi:hypothetical protein
MKRIYLAALAGALLLGGCQLIAGVRNDAVLEDEDGGTDGGTPCATTTDCHGFGICFKGHCCNETTDQQTLCDGRCGSVNDACGRPFECGQCVAPATCGADNTCE